MGVRGDQQSSTTSVFRCGAGIGDRTQTLIPLHPSPLTPGPSPTTASLADARGAAGERGENVTFLRSQPFINSAGVSGLQSFNSKFAMFILQFAISPAHQGRATSDLKFQFSLPPKSGDFGYGKVSRAPADRPAEPAGCRRLPASVCPDRPPAGCRGRGSDRLRALDR